MKKHHKTKGAPPKSRADDATIEQRVQVILQLKLDGVQTWDICRFVSEKEKSGEAPWTMKAGCKPLCRRTIERYMVVADGQIAAIFATQNRSTIHFLAARRESLYARCIEAGDLRAAIIIVQEQTRLADLYPSERKILAGDKDNPLFLHHAGNVTRDPTLEAADAAYAESLASEVIEAEFYQVPEQDGPQSDDSKADDPATVG